MKKALYWLMAFMVAAGALSGCAAKKTAKNDEVPNLVWYVPGDKQQDMNLVLEEVNKRIVPKIGANLSLQFIDQGAFNERMNMSMASGADFDICFSGYVNKYSDAVKHDALLPLSELIEKEAPELKAALPDYAWDGVRLNGEIYAVPNLQAFALPQGIYFIKEYVDKYNFDVNKIKCMDDLEEYLAIIAANEPDVYGFRTDRNYSTWMSADYEQILMDLYVRKDDPACKVLKSYEIPEYIAAVNKLHSWYEKGYIRQDVASVVDDSAEYKAGKYATFIAAVKPGGEQEMSAGIGGKEVVAVSVTNPFITTSSCTQTTSAISKKSKHPAEAIKLLSLMSTDPEIYNLICYGIEGTHYNKTDDGHIKLTGTGYRPNADWKFGNQFNALILEGKDLDVWNQTQKINADAAVSNLLGFTLDTGNMTNEVSQCTTIRSEYSALGKGFVDPAQILPEYQKKLEEAGIDKMVEDTQKQIDEFLKNKN